jgi:hypothetical protein
MNVLLLRAYASAGTCLPNRCLAMVLFVIIVIHFHLEVVITVNNEAVIPFGVKFDFHFWLAVR